MLKQRICVYGTSEVECCKPCWLETARQSPRLGMMSVQNRCTESSKQVHSHRASNAADLHSSHGPQDAETYRWEVTSRCCFSSAAIRGGTWSLSALPSEPHPQGSRKMGARSPLPTTGEGDPRSRASQRTLRSPNGRV